MRTRKPLLWTLIGLGVAATLAGVAALAGPAPAGTHASAATPTAPAGVATLAGPAPTGAHASAATPTAPGTPTPAAAPTPAREPVPGAAPPRMALPPEAGLSYDVRDADTGQPIPCKLTLLGVEGTPDPAFTHKDIGRQDEEAMAAYNRIFSLEGVGIERVPHGIYDVTVSRGPEWEALTVSKVKVGAQGAEVRARLRHVVDTRGWLSGDFHVHAAPSSDSEVPMAHRIFEFVSDGVELIVSTDHNVLSDYAPSIRALDAGRYIASAVGDELTTNGWGHFGAFPLPRELERSGHGAPLVHERAARDIFANVRAAAPEALLDVHHPRLDGEIGYFTLGQLDARADRAGRPGFGFDFDAVEVLNGYQDPVRRSVDRVIDDWFALLNHGHLAAATGNSDTHHLTYNLGGYPRNYVRMADDDPARVDPRQVARAVKDKHSFFTTGPFVRVSVAGAGMGDLARVADGRARVEIQVDAAPWVSVSRVILYVNGRESRRWAVPAAAGVRRFQEGFDLQLARDGWVVVRVDGDKLMAPVVGDRKTFGVWPLALTNPVFLDVDGNGRFDPESPPAVR